MPSAEIMSKMTGREYLTVVSCAAPGFMANRKTQQKAIGVPAAKIPSCSLERINSLDQFFSVKTCSVENTLLHISFGSMWCSTHQPTHPDTDVIRPNCNCQNRPPKPEVQKPNRKEPASTPRAEGKRMLLNLYFLHILPSHPRHLAS
jgi:hypothetical protein